MIKDTKIVREKEKMVVEIQADENTLSQIQKGFFMILETWSK